MTLVATLSEAVGTVGDGALLTFGGFQLNRAPMALVFELIRQGRRDLRVVSVPNPLPLDLLVAAGAVAEAEFGFIGFQCEDGFVVAPTVKTAIEKGALLYRERDVYEIVQGLRAAALGLPFLAAPGGEGSDYARVNRTPEITDPATGGRIPVSMAIRPDVALLHVQLADRKGNLRIDDPYADELLARASLRVIASAEKIVERIDEPTIPGAFVDLVVEAPGGAFPTSCHRAYRYGLAHLREYVAAASAGRPGDYLRTYVAGTRDHAAFLSAVESPGGWDGPALQAPGGVSTSPSARPPTGTAWDAARPADRLVVEMARLIKDGDVVATGVASALPMLAVALARATHARGLTYFNCVGAVDPDIRSASPTSVDPRLLERCEGRVSLPGLFDLAHRGGIDLMFFGVAQVDALGRTNLTCIGEYDRPRVKLPGPAGSSSMRSHVPKIVITVPRHSQRALVESVDFATTAAAPANRDTSVVTDLGLFRLQSGRLALVSRRDGVRPDEVRAQTGFAFAGDGDAAPGPTENELNALALLDPAGIRHAMV
ncbi:MAG TPA: CoA-transferase [Candidatus Polarisedimenticolia bacterium]|nr:CoA-transferase [Candidatus Polarisedimenticolia bacterium]